MKTIIIAILLSLFAIPAAGDPARRSAVVSNAQPYVLQLGDSITFRSQPNIHTFHADWVVDGVPGRRIDTLSIFAQLLSAQNDPETLIIALGTNSNDSWTKADFDPILNSISPETNVIFVTVYRDPNIWPLAADRMYRISEWMRQIKTERPNTDLADWRSFIFNHPELALLEDGVHPGFVPISVNDSRTGRDIFAEMIHNAYVRLHP